MNWLRLLCWLRIHSWVPSVVILGVSTCARKCGAIRVVRL